MAASISLVQSAQPQQLADAADRAGQSATSMQQQLDTGRQALVRMRTGWEGTASDAASADAERNFTRQQTIVAALERMQAALASGGDQLSATRTAIVDDVARLEQVGFQVADDGTVSIKPGSRLAVLAQSSAVSAMQIQSIAATSSVQLTSRLVDFASQDEALAQALQATSIELVAAQGTSPAGFSQGGPHDRWDWNDPEPLPEIEIIDPGGAGPGDGTVGPIPDVLI